MAALNEVVAEVAVVVNNMIDTVQNGSDRKAKIKTVADSICTLLLSRGLAYKEKVRAALVGVHPENRFGMGVEPLDVHELLKSIVLQGWSWLEVVGARAFEVAPSDGDTFDFNDRLAKSSEGLLAKVEQHELRITSVTCGHTNAGLRCVLGGSKSYIDDITTDGSICQQKVLEMSPGFAEPLRDGLEWLIVRHQLATACPGLASFLQEAGNAGHGIERQQTKMQTLLQIHMKAQRNIAFKGEAQWDNIALDIERTRPFLHGQVKDMCEYVKEYSGGADPTFLKNLDEWSKCLQTRRDIPGKAFSMLAGVPFAQGPEYITACVKAMLVAPDCYCRDGQSRLLTCMDTATITGKNKDLVLNMIAAVKPRILHAKCSSIARCGRSSLARWRCDRSCTSTARRPRTGRSLPTWTRSASTLWMRCISFSRPRGRFRLRGQPWVHSILRVWLPVLAFETSSAMCVGHPDWPPRTTRSVSRSSRAPGTRSTPSSPSPTPS
jgi:hypothetical protein